MSGFIVEHGHHEASINSPPFEAKYSQH
jgi:hypothetical protein